MNKRSPTGKFLNDLQVYLKESKKRNKGADNPFIDNIKIDGLSFKSFREASRYLEIDYHAFTNRIYRFLMEFLINQNISFEFEKESLLSYSYKDLKGVVIKQKIKKDKTP